MKPKQIMLIAGEASGDTLAAELVAAVREEVMAADFQYSGDAQPLRTGLEPRFFGAGGPRMAAAGVELAFDLTEHSVLGITGAVRHYLKFRRILKQLLKIAVERQPDLIICVDFGAFNRNFTRNIKEYARSRCDWFHAWQPKVVQYVSPQVWASRENRVYQIARDYDLLLSIFPFEKDWYARRVPKFPVEFVGHPMMDRFPQPEPAQPPGPRVFPRIVLLPGSRVKELNEHLPVIVPALRAIQEAYPENRATMVLPSAHLREVAADCAADEIEFQVGGLLGALSQADLAIAKTGTIALECAYFGVPTVTFYKADALDYRLAKRMVKVKWLTMPNLIADEEVYPEFIQHQATPENLARAALELLRNETRRARMKTRLADVIKTLGGPGASRRAARAIVRLLEGRQSAVGSQ